MNLARRGTEVHVVAAASADQKRLDQQVRVHEVALSLRRVPGAFQDPANPFVPPWPDPRLVAAITGAARDFAPDVIHAHGWTEMSARLAGARLGLPVVVTLHDYGLFCPQKSHFRAGAVCSHRAGLSCMRCPGSSQSAPKRTALALALALRLNYSNRPTSRFLPPRPVVHYIAVSHYVAAAHSHANPAAPAATIIPNFIDDFVPVTPYNPNGPIVFIGPDTPYKGLPVLLEAQQSLPLHVRRPVLHIGGTRRLQPGYTGLGRLSPDGVTAHLRNAAILAAPAPYADPCPTVILEAMALARPVVASAIGGHSDLLAVGGGLLVEAGSSHSLSVGLASLLGDPSLAERLGVEGRAALQPFTSDAVVPRLMSLYGSLIPRSADT